MSIAPSLLTAADFARIPDPGHPQELLRGVVVDMPPPKPRHGQICGNIYFALRLFAERLQLGHVIYNDSGVVTERDPDSVRGMDVAFICFGKIPPGPLPSDYLDIAPDAVFEVLSPGDRKSNVLRKVTEYLQLGVLAVYVIDAATARVHCYFTDRSDEILSADDELVGTGPLAGFRVSVAKFFA